MSFFLAILAWLVIGAILVVGIVLATAKVTWIVLILGLLAFAAAFSWWGCATQ